MTPYLKGLHLTLDAWRPNRDTKTGWRLQYVHKDKDGDSWMTNVPHPDAPKTVNPVVCLPLLERSDDMMKEYFRNYGGRMQLHANPNETIHAYTRDCMYEIR